MEAKNTKSGRKKSRHSVSLVIDPPEKLYDAASLGHSSNVKEILENWEKQISKDEIEDRVINEYTALKLNNIVLVDDVELQLHEYLVNRCFFHKDSLNKVKVRYIKHHLKLLTEEVDLLKYITDDQELLIFSLKFIVKEIHLLKYWLKSTYDVLPWHEIEFYLLSFIILSTEDNELNIFYKQILRKSDLIIYLEVFMSLLRNVQVGEEKEQSVIPALTREEAIKKITENCPHFKELFEDVVYIRDLYTLNKISKYARILKDTSPQEPSGKQIIMRVLSVISEHLKCNIASPQLSTIRRDLLILSISENSRIILLDLCNSNCSVDSFMSRTRLIKNDDVELLLTIRNDLEHIGHIAEDLLFRQSMLLLAKIFQEKEDCVLQLIENTFPIFQYAKKQLKFIDRRFFVSNTNKLIEILKRITPQVDERKREQLMKILAKLKLKEKDFNVQDNMITYITKPQVRTDFINYFSLRLSSDDVRDILDIMVSIQKDCTTKKDRYQIGRLNEDIFNLLIYELDIDNSIIKTNEVYSVNRNLDFDQIRNTISSKNVKFNFKDLMQERKRSLKRILDRKDYQKIKNDDKSLEIIKSLILDIITISNIEKNGNENDSQNNLMFMDFLKNDYELNDLIFNSNMMTFQIGKKFIQGDPENLMNPGGEVAVKTKSSFQEQFLHILKNQKIISKLMEGDFDEFEKLSKDIRVRDVEKSTFLHLAAERYNCAEIEYLFNEGLRIYSKNVRNQTPLHLAAMKGNLNVVSYLLEEKHDVVDCTDNFGRTALHIAVLHKHHQIAEILVAAGFDPFKKDFQGFTPSLYAVLSGNKQILSILIMNNENMTQSDVEELFHSAINHNLVEIVEFLLSNDLLDLDEKNGKMAMSSAVSIGQVAIVEILLEHNANPKNCILLAAQKNFDLIVEKLLQKDKDVVKVTDPVDHMTALLHAAKNGNPSLIELLLKHNADIGAVDVKNNSALHLSVENGRLLAVQALLENPQCQDIINKLNSKRYTALHIAAENGQFEIAKLLLAQWTELNDADCSTTPLNLARKNGHDNIAELLSKNGAKFTKTQNSLQQNRAVARNINSSNYRGIIVTQELLKNATISIIGADEDDCRRRDDEIINQIIKQNHFERRNKHDMKILRKDFRDGKCNIIMLLEKSLYESVISKGKLNLGWNSCLISDYFNIYRCHKCSGFGHGIEECTYDQVCKRCSGRHHEKECKSEDYNCIHCMEKNESLGLDIDTKHSPFYQFCPWYRKQLKDKYEKQKSNN